jgi:hypothetical protein
MNLPCGKEQLTEHMSDQQIGFEPGLIFPRFAAEMRPLVGSYLRALIRNQRPVFPTISCRHLIGHSRPKGNLLIAASQLQSGRRLSMPP